jgi:uncharacterized lipoprotein YmbA
VSGFRLRLVVAWLVSAVAGCTSAPVHYYTLTPASETPAAGTAFAIDVRVIHTPPQLNRAELIVRTGPAEVTLLENERWASPVRDEIKDALRLELERRLGRAPELRNAFVKLALNIDIQHFEAELGRHALIEAAWTATLSTTDPGPNGARVTSCTFHADETIHAGYSGIVEGYQREIAALADAIMAVLGSASTGSDTPCH